MSTRLRTPAWRAIDLPVDPGFETRWGSRVYRVHGIDHDEHTWWVELTLAENPKIARNYEPASLVHDDTPEAKERFDKLLKAINEMIFSEGTVDKHGRWTAK